MQHDLPVQADMMFFIWIGISNLVQLYATHFHYSSS